MAVTMPHPRLPYAVECITPQAVDNSVNIWLVAVGKNTSPAPDFKVTIEYSTQRAFVMLRDQWKTNRRSMSSSLKEIVSHPAYRAIVRMRNLAIPYIMAELEREPDWWFSALREITGEDPVPPKSRGKMQEMSALWIQWGREHNVRW